MATAHENGMPSSTSAFAFVCAKPHCVGLLQVPSPSDVDTPCSPGAECTTFDSDMHGDSSSLSSAAHSDGDWNEVARHGVPMFGMVQLKAVFVLLYEMVTVLIVQVTVIASDVISLKHRIAAVEGTQTPVLIHDQETEALARQVNELRERVASQEDRIACLECSQHVETESYKKTLQELTTKLDDMKVDDDMKIRDGAFENLCQSFKNFRWSIDCQAARITGVKADGARKIALLQSELASVQADLAAVKIVTAAIPVNASSSTQVAKEARKAQILASVVQRIEHAEMAQEIEESCPVPPVVARSSVCATVFQDMPAASTSSGGSPIKFPNHSKAQETTVKNLANTKEPLITACINVNQPSTIPAIPMIPMIPIPTMPMERLIPAKGIGKENRPCNSSTTTLQDTKPFQPGAGRSPDVSDKPPTASPKKAQPSAGSLSKVSAVLKPRSSMLPAPRKSQYPNVAHNAAVIGGSTSNGVKIAANRPPGGSETRTEQPKTVKCAPIVTSRSPSEPALSRLVEKEPPAVLPASSSLTTLDATLQAMQLDGDDLLAPMPALNCLNDDLSFSAITHMPMTLKTKRNRDDKHESIYVPPKQRNVDVKPLRSPLKSTLAENEIALPAPSSLTALDVALQGEGDVLTLLPGPDYPSVDFSLSAMTPIFSSETPLQARKYLRVSHEDIYQTLAKTVDRIVDRWVDLRSDGLLAEERHFPLKGAGINEW